MRYHLALIASALFSTMVAAAPAITVGHSLNEYSSPADNRQMTPALLKRDIPQDVNQRVQNQLSEISETLVSLANEKEINYDSFERTRAAQYEAINAIEESLNGNVNAFRPELDYAKAFLETIETTSQIIDEYESCDYAGFDSLKHLSEIRVKTYALIFLNEKGEVMHVENLQGEIERYEEEFKDWQDIIQREAVPGLQQISESMTEDYQRDVQNVMALVQDSTDVPGGQGNSKFQNTQDTSRKNCHAY